VSDGTPSEVTSASDLLFFGVVSGFFACAIADSDGVPSDASGYRCHGQDAHATIGADAALFFNTL
jgi:hypothetical protein